MNNNRQGPIITKVSEALISVIIPVYNRISELERAIQSVLKQSWQAFEILVIDDGSDADIKSICDSFNDERIRFFRNKLHENANVARNIGIREAKGEYIAMLDSDDEYLPTHLELRIEKIKEWKCDGIFGSAHVMVHGENRTQISRRLRQGELLINYLLSDGFAPTPSHFYKTSAAADTLWDETLERHQDLDFLVRFSKKFTLQIDPEPTVIIHWEYHDGKDFRLKSCMAFIERYKDDINKRIYCDYHRNMYYKIREFEKPEYVEHYATESYKHIQYISLRSFISVHKKSGYSLVYLLRKFVSLRLAFYIKNLHDHFYDSISQDWRGGKSPFRDH
jgi:glycosyltransferase involved in cell wall biosynthesis